MKRLELHAPPTWKQIAGRLILGGAFAAGSVDIVGTYQRELADARMFDRDGRVGYGVVVEVSRPHRTRREHRSPLPIANLFVERYSISIDAEFGRIQATARQPARLGEKVRFIYSPMLGKAILVGEGTRPGDIHEARSGSVNTVFAGGIALAFLFGAGKMFRWV
jgi:hypothetical protein